MAVVNDIDRPDVGGILPKMQQIAEMIREVLNGITPYLKVSTNDNLMSSVTIWGTYEPKEEWNYGIYENASYFTILIVPHKGKRYYVEGEPVTVEAVSMKYTLPKFRKYTSTPEKVIAKLRTWIENSKP